MNIIREKSGSPYCFPDYVINPACIQSEQKTLEFLGRNSLSFRFAVRFFPKEMALEIARIYVFCRITDDLVDKSTHLPQSQVSQMLKDFEKICRHSYHGGKSGLFLIDKVMHDMAAKSIPFGYAEELFRGVGMDLTINRYQTMENLLEYTYGVAGVLGKWITEISGIRETEVLERAADLGHAMQLTNIARDVGEDWNHGRLYLPLDLLEEFGLSEDAIKKMFHSRTILPEYKDMLEGLFKFADWKYSQALSALGSLSKNFRLPIGVAAFTYQSIHQSIRKNEYDNLTKRAVSSPWMKMMAARKAAQFVNSQNTFRLKPSPAQKQTSPSGISAQPVFTIAGN